MKKSFLRYLINAMIIAGFVFLSACLKDMVDTTLKYTIYTPIYKTMAELRDGIKTADAQPVKSPNKIYIKDDYIFLSEIYRGIHIINNANPASPQNLGYIEIPSNRDMAMKNNTLYADMFGDLLAIDISDPKNAKLKGLITNIFQDYPAYLPDSKITIGYSARDTIIHSRSSAQPKNGEIWYYYDGANANSYSGTGASAAGAAGPVASYGTGGSMARFAATKERLFTVGNNNMSVFNITNDFNPSFVTKKPLPWGIETIFPFKNRLFVGSTTGVNIFSIDNPDNPDLIGVFGHVRRCDPVVANDKYAFVTLRGLGTCGGNVNELDILSIENLASPSLIKSYALDNPYGLSLDGTTLFVCDGASGLKIYDVSDVMNIKSIHTINNITPTDVIAMNGLAIVVANSGLYQYDYKDLKNIKLLSKIEIKK